MQIEWTGQTAPAPQPFEGKLIEAQGQAEDPDPQQAFLNAAAALGRDLAAKGATPAHIECLTIRVPDPDNFRSALRQYDLLYREAMGGNSGRVALLSSTGGVSLTAQAVIPPPSDEPVFAGFNRADLNREYSPRATVPEASAIMAKWRIDGTAYQPRRTAELLYGPDPAHGIDLFLPPTSTGARPPLHVFIHGGYWQALDKRDNGQFGAPLVAAGIAFAALNYPLCPPATVGGIVEACRRALAHLHAQAGQYGYDPARITVSGHSAGGHLVAMLAATDWKTVDPVLPPDLIKGTVAISGLFDVEPLTYTGLNKALRLTVEDARAISPIRYPVTSPGPVIAAVGGAESSEFRRQSRDYVERKRTEGVDAVYLELPGLNHFTVVEAMADTDSVLYRKLVEIAREPDQPA